MYTEIRGVYGVVIYIHSYARDVPSQRKTRRPRADVPVREILRKQPSERIVQFVLLHRVRPSVEFGVGYYTRPRGRRVLHDRRHFPAFTGTVGKRAP